MTKSTPPDFLQNIPCEYIVCPNEKKKDVKWNPRGIKQNWGMEQAMYECSSKEHVECKYDLKGTNLLVIDIDVDDYSIDDLWEDTEIDSTYVKGNTKGLHVYVEVIDGKEDANVVNCMKKCVGDYIGSQVFERLDKDWTGEIAHQVTQVELNKCFHMDKVVKIPKQKVINDNTISPNLYELKEIVDIIDIKYLDNRSDWIKIVLAAKACGMHENDAAALSAKSKNYSDDGFYTLWESYDVDAITVTKGTLIYYARESNREAYQSVYEKYRKNPEDVMDIHKLISMKVEPEEIEEIIPSPSLQKRLDDYTKLTKKEQKDVQQDLDTLRKERGVLVRESKDLASNMTMSLRMDYFQKYHFKLMHPKCYGRLHYNNLDLPTEKDLLHQYGNVFNEPDADGKKALFVNDWKHNEYIRTYNTLDFLPPPTICNKHTYNTFNGFECDRIGEVEDVNIDLFLNHIEVLTGHDKKGTEYLLDYLAHMIQRPGELPRVALVFQSKQGVGKNIFFENFVRCLLGDCYLLQTAEMDKVLGRFSMIDNKIMVIMDETSGKDSFQNSDKIKNLITAQKLTWEKKFGDPIRVKNCGRYIFFSNNDTPVKIEILDRRFVVYRCSNDFINDIPYFSKMMVQFEDERYQKALSKFFKERDISKWDSTNDRPITDAYKDIQSSNIPKIANWLEEKIYEFHVSQSQDGEFEMHRFHATTFYKSFKTWLTDGGNNYEYTSTKFGRDLKKYNGIEKKRSARGQEYVIDYEKLKDFMIGEKYMNELENVYG
mgnify:CR=1 FL=1